MSWIDTWGQYRAISSQSTVIIKTKECKTKVLQDYCFQIRRTFHAPSILMVFV
jgi:hypothetical protein